MRSLQRPGRAAQAGVLMLEVSLALIIAALAAYGTVREMVRTQAMQVAISEADTLGLYRQALQDFVDENYGALQFGLPITRNGVTLAPGNGLGQTLQPSVSNLRNMGYLNAGFSDLTLVVDGGAFRNVIERQPSGCVDNACNIVGLAYISLPVTIRGTTASNSLVVGQMLARLGGLGGASIEGSAANVTGAGAAWNWPNPVAGTPAGVMGARFGFGSSTFAGYVRMNDTRDPNLQGNLTVAGSTTIKTNLTVNGTTSLAGDLTSTADITARNFSATETMSAVGSISSSDRVGASDTLSCLRAALEASGSIVSRALDCVTRVQISNTGVSVKSASGTDRITLAGDTGLLAVRTTSGAQTIGLDGATGRISGQRLRVDTTAARGSPCTGADDLVTDVDAMGTILVCKSGVWRDPGLPQGTVGAACTSIGSLARNAADQALICRSNGWALLNDRVTAAVTMDLWSGNGVANVPVPVCGAGGVADISVAALQGGSDYGVLPPRNRFEVRVSGSGPWTVTPAMVDQDGGAYTSDSKGNPYALGWTATTFCRYAS